MTQTTEFRGQVKETIQDESNHRATLGAFEELTGGVSPVEVVRALGSSAAEECGVKDCGLQATCNVDEDRFEGDAPGPNSEWPYAKRIVSAEVTCSRSASRKSCRVVIERTTDDIETLFDQVKGGGPAAQAEANLMGPAWDKAEEIEDAAAVKARKVVKEAEDGVDAARDAAVADFRERYGA